MTNSEHETPERRTDLKPPAFIARSIATGLFSGYSPWASGTVGTLVGIAFYLIPGFENPAFLLAATIVTFLAGVVTAAKVAEVEGHRLTKSAKIAKARFQPGDHTTPDPSIVVIDEIVGMWIALLFLPKTVLIVVVAFFAFRFFDIVKPWPARQFERIPNGWGIMLDDVIAGAYANFATWGVYFFVNNYFPQLM